VSASPVENGQITVAPEEFDRERVRAKYAEEREKRLRSDGSEQYLHIEGGSRFLADPNVESVIERDPISEDIDVAILGGGFSGLLAGARLRQRGVQDLRIIERGGDFGGTWYWNRYPGAQCDTEAYVYMPLLEEVGYIPKEKYARAPEILDHSRNIGRTFDLYDKALFQTEVSELCWDDGAARWIVLTNRGDRIRARFVVWCLGGQNRAKLPGLPGIEEFQGVSFHSSRWDYSYTGGHSEGDLTGLSDQRVAVIGTGASAVQIVPHVGRWAQRLYVFQRTPSGVDRRDNRPTDPEWAASLEPGWQKRRIENFTNLVSGIPEPEDLVNDAWTDLIGHTMRLMQEQGAEGMSPEQVADLMELADFQKMESIRRRVDSIVDDPATAEALKPYYKQFCKRPCFHDEYLQTFNRPNVILVDTNGKGVEAITARGLVANGVEYEVDCIIYATGFEIASAITQKVGFEVFGRDGVQLSRPSRPGSFQGMLANGFPNLLFSTYFGSAHTVNMPHNIDNCATHISWIIDTALTRNVRTIEPTAEAVKSWIKLSISFNPARQYSDPTCTPGYFNNEGKGFRNTSFTGGVPKFLEILGEWRDDGTFDGLEVTYEPSRVR
jgi:cyclohexanone monooxygenase